MSGGSARGRRETPMGARVRESLLASPFGFERDRHPRARERAAAEAAKSGTALPPEPPPDPLLDGVQRLRADDDGPRGRTPGVRD